VSWDRSQLVGLGIPLRFIAKPSYARHCTNPNVGSHTSDKVDRKNQIDELVQVQSRIIVDCFKIVNDIEYLSNASHTEDIAEVISGDRFFIRAGNYMWTVLILELNKLFDKKEDYALSKTLNIAINNFSKVQWDKNESLDGLTKLKNEIEDRKIQDIIGNLNHIRDKQYAHLDRDRFDKEVLINLSEVRRLLDLSQKTLSEIHWRLHGAGLSLDVDFLGLCEMTVKNLAEYNKIRN